MKRGQIKKRLCSVSVYVLVFGHLLSPSFSPRSSPLLFLRSAEIIFKAKPEA
eukprot:m.87095 g.87095  ORF g.87095 m.87095 type:complete len:52 (-) comp21380_c0_seq4:2349-2504(-)